MDTAAGIDIVIAMEFLESSSSEDDLFSFQRKRLKVENFMKPLLECSDVEWRRHIRISRSTFQYLLNLYEESRPPNHHVAGKTPVPADKQLLCFLWFAGNKTTIREVALLFHISESSCHKYLHAVMDFLVEKAPLFIKMPQTEDEKTHASQQFQQISGMPGIIGCIDGSYISCKKPANKIRNTYINRHDMVSTTLQGICDSQNMFLDVFVGTPSKIHDARVFKLSFISSKLQSICGTQYHILGDLAYPLKEWLLTPYRVCLTRDDELFNERFAKARVKIENTFAILKDRFRQLMHIELTRITSISKFIMACCALHNMAIMQGDQWSDDTHVEGGSSQEGDELPAGRRTDTEDKRRGEEKRKSLVRMMRESNL